MQKTNQKVTEERLEITYEAIQSETGHRKKRRKDHRFSASIISTLNLYYVLLNISHHHFSHKTNLRHGKGNNTRLINEILAR